MGDMLFLTKELWEEFKISIESLKPRKMSHDQIQLMFEVLLTGAMRINEVLNIKPEDILPNGKIRLPNTKGGIERCKCSVWKFRPVTLVSSDKNCIKCNGLGKYPIDQYAWVQDSVLTKLRALADKTIPGDRLFPIHARQVLNYCHDIMNIRTHTFRHTWLTWLLESEKVSIKDLKLKARHKNIQTTINYIEQNEDLTRQKEKDSGVRI